MDCSSFYFERGAFAREGGVFGCQGQVRVCEGSAFDDSMMEGKALASTVSDKLGNPSWPDGPRGCCIPHQNSLRLFHFKCDGKTGHKRAAHFRNVEPVAVCLNSVDWANFPCQTALSSPPSGMRRDNSSLC